MAYTKHINHVLAGDYSFAVSSQYNMHGALAIPDEATVMANDECTNILVTTNEVISKCGYIYNVMKYNKVINTYYLY